MSVELKKRINALQGQLRELRQERATKRKAQEDARDAFLGAGVEPKEGVAEYDTAREATRAVGDIDDQIAGLERDETNLLNLLGEEAPEGPTNGNGDRPAADAAEQGQPWSSAHLFDGDVRAVLAQLSGSKARVGSIQLGEVASRDRLAADITGTPSMRRGTYLGVVPQVFRPLRVLDLIPVGTTDGNLVPYTQEGGNLDAGAAETAEGTIKPEGNVTFTDADALVQTIASWQKIRKQALADVPYMQSTVDGRLRYTVMRRLERQILAGDGTGSNLTGVLNTAGIGNVAFSAAVPVSELILTGITQVYLADGQADGIVMNPLNWQTALTQKAQLSSGPPPVGSGEYVGGGPFSVTPQVMWGVPLIPSPALASGNALVGDFQIGLQLLIREGVNVLLSDSDQDDFIKNRVTLLGEMRAALPVYRPTLFQKVATA